MTDRKIVDSHSLTIVNLVKQTFKLVFKKPLFLFLPFVGLGVLTFILSLFVINYSNPLSIVMSGNINESIWKIVFTIFLAVLDVLLIVFLALISIFSTKKLLKGEKLDRTELLNQIKEKYLGILGISAIQLFSVFLPIMLFGVLAAFIPILGFFIAIAGIVFGVIIFVRLLFADYYYLFEGKNLKESLKQSSDFIKKIDARDVFFKYVGLGIAFGFISLARYFVFVPRLSSIVLGIGAGKGTFIITFFSQIIKYFGYIFMLVAWTLVYFFYKEKEELKEQGKTIEEKKEKFGCFFYGCIGTLILVVIGTFSMIFAVNKFVKYAVLNWTTDQVIELPKVSLSTGDIEIGMQKLALLQNMISFNSGDSITIGENDINAFIFSANSGDLKSGENYLDYLVFKIENGQINTHFSLPLDKLPFKMLKGRFLNGNFGFILKPDNIYPIYLVLVEGKFNGKSLPANILSEFKKGNLIQSLYQQSYQYPWINNIKSAQINQDNQIFIEIFGSENESSTTE